MPLVVCEQIKHWALAFALILHGQLRDTRYLRVCTEALLRKAISSRTLTSSGLTFTVVALVLEMWIPVRRQPA